MIINGLSVKASSIFDHEKDLSKVDKNHAQFKKSVEAPVFENYGEFLRIFNFKTDEINLNKNNYFASNLVQDVPLSLIKSQNEMLENGFMQDSQEYHNESNENSINSLFQKALHTQEKITQNQNKIIEQSKTPSFNMVDQLFTKDFKKEKTLTQGFKNIDKKPDKNTSQELLASNIDNDEVFVQALNNNTNNKNTRNNQQDSNFEKNYETENIKNNKKIKVNKASEIYKNNTQKLSDLKELMHEFDRQLKNQYPQLIVKIPHPNGFLTITIKGYKNEDKNLNIKISSDDKDLIDILEPYKARFLQIINNNRYNIAQDSLIFTVE